MQREGCNHDAKLQHCDVHHTMCALLRPQGQINDCSMRLDRARQALAKACTAVRIATSQSILRESLLALAGREHLRCEQRRSAHGEVHVTHRGDIPTSEVGIEDGCRGEHPASDGARMLSGTYHATAPTVRSVDSTAPVVVRRRARCRLFLCTCNLRAARAGMHACLCVGVCTCPRHFPGQPGGPSSRHARSVADSGHGSLHRLFCCGHCIEQVRLRPLARARGTLHRRRRGAAQLRRPLPGVFVAWLRRQWQCAAAAGVAHVVEWF